jgi:hypothetical protein
MPLFDILTKQQRLQKLSEQLIALQQEVDTIRSENPLYTKKLEELINEKEELQQLVNAVIKVELPGFATIECRWRGIGLLPHVDKCTFQLDMAINEFLLKTLVDYDLIQKFFEIKHTNIIDAITALDKLDERLKSYNLKVEELSREFEDVAVSELKIKENFLVEDE